MSGIGRNFPMDGRTWKNPDGSYPHDWTMGWLVGAAVLTAFIILVAFAYGLLR